MQTPSYETVQEVVRGLDNDERGMTFDSRSAPRFVPFTNLGQEIRRTGAAFSGAGIMPGDRVILILPDEQQFILAFFGALWTGVVPVPLFPPFLLAQIDTYVEHVRRVVQQCNATSILTIPEIADLLHASDPSLSTLGFDDLPAQDEIDPPSVTGRSLAFIQYTSGSTATPKGVAVTHRALLMNTLAFVRHMQIDPEYDRGVTWLPLYHDMGLIGGTLMPLLLQASVWYMPPLEFARQPLAWCELIHEVRGTIQFAPNFAYSFLTRRATEEDLERLDLSCWRIAGCGAEPIRPEVMRAFERRFAPTGLRPTALLPCYGLAEATLAVALSDHDRPWRCLHLDAERLRRSGIVVQCDANAASAAELVSCGRAIPDHEVRIVDKSGGPLTEGHDGEVEVRGPCVMTHYYDNLKATEQVLRDGWLRTRDRGFIYEGELYVTGRTADLIIVNGRNVHPQDIEWCVAAIDGVRQGNVVVFGNETAESEDVVVVLECSQDTDIEALTRLVKTTVRAQCGLAVADVLVLEKGTLPKTTSGKLRRRATREGYEAKRLSTLQEA